MRRTSLGAFKVVPDRFHAGLPPATMSLFHLPQLDNDESTEAVLIKTTRCVTKGRSLATLNPAETALRRTFDNRR